MLNFIDRIGAGENAPPEHPLMEAARNSSEPKWAGSFFAVNDPDKWVRPTEDLSEAQEPRGRLGAPVVLDLGIDPKYDGLLRRRKVT